MGIDKILGPEDETQDYVAPQSFNSDQIPTPWTQRIGDYIGNSLENIKDKLSRLTGWY